VFGETPNKAGEDARAPRKRDVSAATVLFEMLKRVEEREKTPVVSRQEPTVTNRQIGSHESFLLTFLAGLLK